MRICLHLTAIGASLLAPFCSAQTLIVDANNGPGTSFTNLPAATTQAPDGAVLLVRPATYSPFVLGNKSLTILCEPGVLIAGTVQLGPTQPHQTLTIRGLEWSTAVLSTGTRLIDAQSCQGGVVLQGIVMPENHFCLPSSPFGLCYRTDGIYAGDCQQLALRECTIRCATRFVRSRVLIEDCEIRGEHHLVPITDGRTAINARDSVLQIGGNSLIAGGDGFTNGGRGYARAGSGIIAVGSDIRFLGGVLRGGGNTGGWTPIPFGGHTLLESTPIRPTRIEPRVSLSGPFGPQTGTATMPMLSGSGGPPGGSLTSTLTTQDGDLAILVVGLPGTPTIQPGLGDAFWLDAMQHVFVAVGIHQTSNPIAGSITIPNHPGFRGLRLHWQAVCQGPVTGFQATNPAVTLVR